MKNCYVALKLALKLAKIRLSDHLLSGNIARCGYALRKLKK